MTANDLLDLLRAQGFKVQGMGASLMIAPRAELTPELRSLLFQHKFALMDLLAHEEHDPRPDLLEDSSAWLRLLELAYEDAQAPEGLYGALRGMRSLGARLENSNTTWRLIRGALDEAEYITLRDEYLVPHRTKLTQLLRDLTQRAEAA